MTCGFVMGFMDLMCVCFEEVELVVVVVVIEFVCSMGVFVHILYTSMVCLVVLLCRVRFESIEVSVEICVYYFMLDVEGFDVIVGSTKMYLLVRGMIDRDVLWEVVVDGTIGLFLLDYVFYVALDCECLFE